MSRPILPSGAGYYLSGPDGKGFTVAEEFQTKSPEGTAVNNQFTRKWIMWADGSLTIDLYQDGPRGSFETKRVFTKK